MESGWGVTDREAVGGSLSGKRLGESWRGERSGAFSRVGIGWEDSGEGSGWSVQEKEVVGVSRRDEQLLEGS